MEPEIQNTTHESQSWSSMAAAQLVASVDDLLIEIFLFLPVKSLVRFQSVSKHWQSLISDPGFLIRRNRNPNPATALILRVPFESQPPPDSTPYAHIISFNFTNPAQIKRTLKFEDSWSYYDKTIIKSCCNGLILMCRSYITGEEDRTSYDNYVCNPTTDKFLKLPQTPHEPDWLKRPMCLAFDPSNSPHYKVVCVVKLVSDNIWTRSRYKFMVYSSETGCWRKSRVKPFQSIVGFERGVYWNGAIHWVSFYKTEKSIYFNPDDDRMCEEMMPTPPMTRVGCMGTVPIVESYYFGESCGHLHYADTSWMVNGLVVYELRRDYSEWFVKYRICDPWGQLCALVRSENGEDSFGVFMMDGKLVRYDFLDKSHETMCEVESAPVEECFSTLPEFLPLQHADSLCFV